MLTPDMAVLFSCFRKHIWANSSQSWFTSTYAIGDH